MRFEIIRARLINIISYFYIYFWTDSFIERLHKYQHCFIPNIYN